MNRMKMLNQEYRAAFEAYKDCKASGDNEGMQAAAHDLSKIAEQMETES